MKKLCVFLRFFFFCLSISNTESLALCSEAERTWLAASLEENILSHCLLHPQNCTEVENRLKANQQHQIRKWNIFWGSSGCICFSFQGSSFSLSSKSAFPSQWLKSYTDSELTHQKQRVIRLSTLDASDDTLSFSSQCPRSSRAAPSSSRSTVWWTASTASLESLQISRNCGNTHTHTHTHTAYLLQYLIQLLIRNSPLCWCHDRTSSKGW